MKTKTILIICLWFAWLLTVGTFFSSCKDEEPAAPVIESISPESARATQPITIKGRNFSNKKINIVTFNGIQANTAPTSSTTELLINIPASATSGDVTVTVDGRMSNPVRLTIIEDASLVTLAEVSPQKAKAGASITLTGTSFDDKCIVLIANEANKATITSVTPTQIVAVLSTDAKQGPTTISVRNSDGVASGSLNFTVIPPNPIITSITPTHGQVASEVIITGENFGPVFSLATVKFGDVTATMNLTKSSLTQLVVNVPVGAQTGSIHVITPDAESEAISEVFTVDASGNAYKTFFFGGIPIGSAQSEILAGAVVNESQTVSILFDETDNIPAGDMFGVAYGSEKVYWSNTDYTISRGNSDGSGTPEILLDNTDGLFYNTDIELDLTNNRIYWINYNDVEVAYEIKSASLLSPHTDVKTVYSGNTVNNIVDMVLNVSNNKIYWIESSDKMVYAGSLDGQTTPTVLYDESEGLVGHYQAGLAVSGSDLYFSDKDSNGDFVIRRGNINGTTPLLTAYDKDDNVDDPGAIVVDVANSKVYWVNSNPSPVDSFSEIMGADLSSSSATAILGNLPIIYGRFAID